MSKAPYRFYPKQRALKDGTLAPYLTCRYYFPLDSKSQKSKDVPIDIQSEQGAERWFLDVFRPTLTIKSPQQVSQLAPQLVQPAVAPVAVKASKTFSAFAETWTDGTLHEKFPDQVGEKNHTHDISFLRMYINPVIGHMAISTITLDDCDRVMSLIPKAFKSATRKGIAQTMRKVLSLAVYPGRFISHSPIPKEWMPKLQKKDNRAKSHLWPEEDAKLMACADVHLARRLAYGILAREGLRVGELAKMTWNDLDLDKGRVRLDQNKTDDARAWALRPDVVRVLTWWKKNTKDDRGTSRVIPIRLAEITRFFKGEKKRPTTGHGDLGRAGVDRAELFEDSKKRQPIRIHDLRATFVTISLANGKSETWVRDRTGHTSSQMLARYTRGARQWAELQLGELGEMDRLLPEMPQPKKATARKPNKNP